MDSRVVLVTGSSSGIGKAIALLFAQNGYKVVVHGSRSQEKVDKVVDECNKLSPNNNKALGLVADFSSPENADSIVTRTIDHFGSLDVLVSNAGCHILPDYTDSDAMYSLYEKVRTIEIDSTVRLTYKAIEHLRKSTKNPNIVFISSVDVVKKPRRGLAPYSYLKSTITMFGKSLAVDLAPTIRSNIVSPGLIDTPPIHELVDCPDFSAQSMIDETLMKRIGKPQDVANAVLYLAGDKSAWITGADIVVDGGMSISP